MICVGDQRAEFSTKRNVAQDQWSNGKVKGNSEEARTVNTYLKQIEAEIFEHYLALVGKKKPITADSLKDAYLGVKPDTHTLLQVIEYHNVQLKETLEYRTLKNYFTTEKYVVDSLFLQRRSSNQVSFRIRMFPS